MQQQIRVEHPSPFPFCRTPAENPRSLCKTGASAEQRCSTSRQAERRGAGTDGARTGGRNRQQGMRPRWAATTASTTGGRENSRGSVWPNGSATAGGRGWLSAGPAALRQAEDSRAPRWAANRQIRDGRQEAATGGRWEQRTAGESRDGRRPAAADGGRRGKKNPLSNPL